ncbi:DUF2071 domain-containing protein [Sediminibacter sp. Hel_I_10]|uniref:DUF2071 domain-containing protein n=1 Tax=Sediminibacter sp. Hel_I_10 TaxID=1392490 RepID=UPI000478E2FB|nr:DUF2071 domain-containing protein [Sediminibacter sp. Hel_I_10]
MIKSLKNHPFAVEAFFDSSIVLTFAVPKKQLENLIPECLELDTYNNEWAFLAMAMVQTKNLRPKGFPKILGNDFFLIGYRIFVKYLDKRGKRLRGLYIIKSETDKMSMALTGNIFTHYNYTHTDISKKKNEQLTEIISKKSNINITLDDTENLAQLPKDSPFPDWKTARKYAGPLPFTFTYNAQSKEVLIIEGVRKNWKPKPISVLNHQIGHLDTLQLKDAVLANAFIIENIPYYWKKGRIESWK